MTINVLFENLNSSEKGFDFGCIRTRDTELASLQR